MSTILVHVSTVIPSGDGRVLFVREAKIANRGLWNLPGGHVEFGEHLSAAALREVREEVLLEVQLQHYLGTYNAIGSSSGLHSIRHVFLAEPFAHTSEAGAGDEILEIVWKKPEEMLALADTELLGAKYIRAILNDYLEGVRHPLDVVREV